MMAKKEMRLLMGQMEVRSLEDGKKKICGYAARFNELSADFGGWKEKIMPGAFDGVLEKSDVRALFNHDPNIVLGRQSAGTLTVKIDSVGLYYEIDPPDTQQARDLMTSIERKDIDGSSFAFVVDWENGGTVWERAGDFDIRNIIKFGEIFDISPVTYPAYPTTEADLRSMDDIHMEKPADAGGEKRNQDFAADASALALKISILEKEGVY